MGIFSSYFKLRDMADEMAEKSDVSASMSEMQARLNAANAAMKPAPAPAGEGATS